MIDRKKLKQRRLLAVETYVAVQDAAEDIENALAIRFASQEVIEKAVKIISDLADKFPKRTYSEGSTSHHLLRLRLQQCAQSLNEFLVLGGDGFAADTALADLQGAARGFIFQSLSGLRRQSPLLP